MAREVAAVMNGADDAELREVAFKGVVWAIAFANIAKRMRFSQEETAVLPLVENQNYITIPKNFIGVKQVRAVMNDGNPAYPQALDAGEYPSAGIVPYETYPQFMNSAPDEQSDLSPVAWSARNTFADSRLLLRSRPSSTAAANFSMQVEFDVPVTLPASQGSVIIAPKDFEIVIKEGAKYYLLFERKREDVQGYRFQYGIFEQMLDRYELNDQKRNAHQHAVWRIGSGT